MTAYIAHRPTPDMYHALAAAQSTGSLSPWGYSSHAIGALKRLGWIEALPKQSPRDGVRYGLTDAGRDALAGRT